MIVSFHMRINSAKNVGNDVHNMNNLIPQKGIEYVPYQQEVKSNCDRP